MRNRRPVRIAIVLLTLVFLGCSGPSMVERGDENLKRGNYEVAASNYEAALAKDPDDAELRAKYQRAADLAVEANMEEARLALGEGAFEDAIFSAERALKWGAGREDVKRFATGIEQRVASEVGRRTTDGMYASAVDLAGLGIDHLPEQFSLQISKARSDAIAEWSRWLLAEAEDADERGAVATRAVFLAEAARVTGDGAIRGRAKRSIDEVRSQHFYSMAVSSAHNQGAEVLDMLPSGIGSAAIARGRLSTADFAVEIAFDDLNVWDDIVTETRSKDYVSGYVNRKNPEWVHIRRDIRRIEHQLEDTELELVEARRLWEARPNARNESRYRAIGDKVEILEDRLRDRERDLFRADEFIREKVYSVHHWEVQRVTRTAQAEVTLRWTDPGTGRPVSVTEPLRIVERDSAQQGYRDANVPHDPLQLTPVAQLEDQLARGAAAEVVTLLEESYASHVNEVSAQLQADVDAAEGAAAAVILWSGADPSSLDRLVQLTDVEPQVGELIGAI